MTKSPGTEKPRVRDAFVALALCAAAAGCAPDSMNNRQATGYNAYLDTIASQCNPLMLGIYNVGEWLTQQGSNNPNYSYFLDITSRLYYGTVSQAAYRDSITGFFGTSSTNEAAFACIFRNLPQRLSAPPA